ncbi:MAG: hypothetical protein ABI051_15505 [Vicinamibacterales bacterium]
MPWTYPAELVDALAAHGLAPSPTTAPVFVRDAVNDLYRYELRAARDRHKAGAIVKADYLETVVALRKKYWVLTLPAAAWERICGHEGPPSPEAQVPTGRRKRPVG